MYMSSFQASSYANAYLEYFTRREAKSQGSIDLSVSEIVSLKQNVKQNVISTNKYSLLINIFVTTSNAQEVATRASGASGIYTGSIASHCIRLFQDAGPIS